MEMDFQEEQALEGIFNRYQYLDPQERVYIRSVVEAWQRPKLQPAPRQCFGNVVLGVEVVDLWERRAARLSEMDLVSNPHVDTTVLPEDHPIDMLDRARKQFGVGILPPFGLSNRGYRWNTVVVPSMNERRPERPTEVRLMRRSWDKNTTFWTLDLNGHRYIVSHLSGGRYHAWIDRDDFAKGIIAFASANHTAPSRESSSGTENEDDCPKRSKDAVAPHTLRSGQAIRRESPSANAATVKVQSPKEYAALPPGGLVERPQRALETRPRNALKTGLRPNFLAPPTRSVALKKKKAPNLSILPSRSASHAVSQRATNSGVISTSRHVSEGETAPSPASNIKLAPLVPGQVHQLEPVLPPPLLPSNARNSVLSNHKRRNTRMAISIEISGQIHPKGSKSLRSCSNIEAFLEVLCNKCHITEASIATVTVRFPWLADRPPRQVIRLDQNVGFVGSLFDEVDNAPCWQEGGTPCCDIHVTVSQKPGWDEDHHQTMLSIFPEP